MKLDIDALAECRRLRQEAETAATQPDGSWSTTDVAQRFADALADLEGSGVPWVAEFLASLLARGAAEWLRDDRRTSEPGLTRRGVALPDTTPARDVHGRHLRRPLAQLDRDALRAYRETVAARVNAAKATAEHHLELLAELDALLEAMEADPDLATVADAAQVLNAMEEAA